MREKSRRRQTGSSGVLWSTFGQLGSRGRGVKKRLAAIFLLPVWPLEPSVRFFLPYSGLYCRGIAYRRLEMLSVRKLGAPNLNLWPESTI